MNAVTVDLYSLCIYSSDLAHSHSTFTPIKPGTILHLYHSPRTIVLHVVFELDGAFDL